MGSVDVTARRHRHRLITTFITMKPYSVISLGAIIGQADNVMLSVMQSVPAHLNNYVLHSPSSHSVWSHSQMLIRLEMIGVSSQNLELISAAVVSILK